MKDGQEWIMRLTLDNETMTANVERVGEIIRCKECEGYDEGRCRWWYDDPEVSSDGYCYQAVRKKNEQNK